ncbi:uncharacterized protein EV154DRAFT_537141 [Mucor mucedo]|uniref:uncharacterized protein n=1 Tax=Mucor mucedo TaxID=29922 RepID=UPI0022211D8F|nr:uncharacterized protein EV154DRAFT_537141 [Mucor mucedo]KAI7893292.1 hypothetical protein EV154DRAFT_537141 [Mucor mucedo]
MLLFKRFFTTLKKYAPADQLESIHRLSLSVNGTSSTIEKHALLAQFPACHSTLKRIYDPHTRLFITSKSAKAYLTKQTNMEPTTFHHLDDLLDALSSRHITGKAASQAVASFYTTYCHSEAHQNIFWRIIDRNLKMGVSVQTVDHTILRDPTKMDVSRISVALATSYTPNKLTDVDGWYVSQKLDGVRCIAMIRSTGDIQFYSRTGRLFTSLQKVRAVLEHQLKKGVADGEEFVLDGEICAYADDGDPSQEDFVKASSQVRRTNEEMENPVFQVFDRIRLQDFIEKSGDQTLLQRQEALQKFVGKDPLDHIKVVKQAKLNSLEEFEHIKAQAVEKGWEGLMLRKDVPYEGKRTRNMLKVKQWEDGEYIVKSTEMGLMRMPDTGEDKYVTTNVIIEHKGYPVSVGSGFTLQNRIDYAKDPSLIIGKPITVRYFSESKKDNGAISLRFPSVKAVYGEGKRDI